MTLQLAVTPKRSRQAMGKAAMRKGKVAEAEIKTHLYEQLGLVAQYNRTQQAAYGGGDLVVYKEDNPQGTLGLHRYLIEVKHQALALPDQWWKQAINATCVDYPCPLLFWKRTRQPWKVRCGLHILLPIHSFAEHYMDVSLECFWFLAREGKLQAPSFT